MNTVVSETHIGGSPHTAQVNRNTDVEINWNNKEPIYLQLRDRLVALILDGVLLEGDAVPSVRQISSEQRINPITVSKALQMLVDDQLIEKKRGLGMYVVAGARARLSKQERAQFLEQEWPQIAERINRLGLDAAELLGRIPAESGTTDGADK